jgi:hypothetical protein
VEDPAAGRHPLDVSVPQDALDTSAVLVVDLALDDVRDGLEAPVGVPRKTCEVLVGISRSEVVEQEERVRFVGDQRVAEGLLSLTPTPSLVSRAFRTKAK